MPRAPRERGEEIRPDVEDQGGCDGKEDRQDRTRMPARRRSRGHDRRHNTSSLVHSSGGTYTRSVSFASPFLSPSLSLVRALSIPSARTCVSSRCKHRATLACTRVYAYRRGSRARVLAYVCVLSRLSFFPPPLSRRVEGNLTFSPPTLVQSSFNRPQKHTLRQGDLLGKTSSSTQPWTRFLYASLLQSPSVSLVVVRLPRRLPLLLSIVLAAPSPFRDSSRAPPGGFFLILRAPTDRYVFALGSLLSG